MKSGHLIDRSTMCDEVFLSHSLSLHSLQLLYVCNNEYVDEYYDFLYICVYEHYITLSVYAAT